jgi:hypothetical protein
MQYLWPVQDPALAAAMRLIPAEEDVGGLCDDLGHKRGQSKKENAVASHTVSVYDRCRLTYSKANNLTSIDVLRIKPHSKRFVTGKRSI